jgi:hypothetical protein
MTEEGHQKTDYRKLYNWKARTEKPPIILKYGLCYKNYKPRNSGKKVTILVEPD